MAGRLLPPDTGVEDVPPLPHPSVPVVRHRGSNTLNFDFHPPQTCGTAERGRVTPGSSVSDWYQTWPAKEAKTPSTPAPPSPMPGPGATTPACPRPPGWSATWTKDSKRRERRWVKYDGIGPVDETGMPIASRSSVDQPRDWYRSMFRQIHRKLPEPDWDTHRCPTGKLGPSPPTTPLTPPQNPRRKGPPPAEPPGVTNGLDCGCPRGGGAQLLLASPHISTGPAGVSPVPPAEPGSIFDYEPGKFSVLEQPWQPLAAVPPARAQPIEVLLERELEQLSQELDEDMRAMETRRRPGQSSAAAPTARSPAPASPAPRSPLSPRRLQSPPGTHRPPASPGMERGGLGLASDRSRAAPGRDTLRPGTLPSLSDLGDPVEAVRREEKKMKAARLKFNFQAESPKELTLQKGDIVYIHKEVDRNWLEGEHHGRVGIFPLQLRGDPAPHRGAQAHQGTHHPGAGVRRGPGALQLPRGAAGRALLPQAPRAPHRPPPAPRTLRPPNPRSRGAQPGPPSRARPQGHPPSPSPSLPRPTTAPKSSGPRTGRCTSTSPKTPTSWSCWRGTGVDVMQQCDDGWFVGVSRRTQKFGTFPGNYVAPV
ncbi:unnamed protein product [Bubo scandiacus]